MYASWDIGSSGQVAMKYVVDNQKRVHASVEPQNADTFWTRPKCPVYRGVWVSRFIFTMFSTCSYGPIATAEI